MSYYDKALMSALFFFSKQGFDSHCDARFACLSVFVLLSLFPLYANYKGVSSFCCPVGSINFRTAHQKSSVYGHPSDRLVR